MEINTLKKRWLDLGLFPLQKEAEIAFDKICKLYSEKCRYYHTLEHISYCLDLFDSCINYIGMPQELEVAIWLHDVIYDPEKSTNEQLSADFAVELLSAIGTDPKKIHIINDLLLCTKHPSIPVSNDEKYLIGIDLSILGADKETYAQYSKYD
jgi:predicted metal-dependent HD superfamily phosphohydrolase